jgi:hypothetical protein
MNLMNKFLKSLQVLFQIAFRSGRENKPLTEEEMEKINISSSLRFHRLSKFGGACFASRRKMDGSFEKYFAPQGTNFMS